MDCDELVGVYLSIIDTNWWATDWDRRDVLLIWMGFWGWCTKWGLVAYSPCCCLVINRQKWVWRGLIVRDYICAVLGMSAWRWDLMGFWNGAW